MVLPLNSSRLKLNDYFLRLRRTQGSHHIFPFSNTLEYGKLAQTCRICYRIEEAHILLVGHFHSSAVVWQEVVFEELFLLPLRGR